LPTLPWRKHQSAASLPQPLEDIAIEFPQKEKITRGLHKFPRTEPR
jgi:hypothetical protein